MIMFVNQYDMKDDLLYDLRVNLNVVCHDVIILKVRTYHGSYLTLDLLIDNQWIRYWLISFITGCLVVMVS